MKLRYLTRSVAAAAAGTAVILGGVVVTAPAASAGSLPKACTTVDYPSKEKVTTAVNLRTGPGTKYTSKGILFKNTKFEEYCNKGTSWTYGKVGSGANKGKLGWVAYKYMK